jgi:MoaA/NifB/PqqE/SkfB family radical SAM enzyme
MHPIQYIYIGGGEPFIRSDLFEILRIIYESAKPQTINISTNGQIFENTIETVHSFLKRYPKAHLIVKVSIDGIGNDHDLIRELPGAFERAVATYKSLSSLKKKHRNLKVGINTVFSSLNQDKIFWIYDYISGLNPRPDCLGQLLVRDKPRDPSCKDELKLKNYEKWTGLYIKDMLRGRFEHDILVKMGTILMYDYIVKSYNRNTCLDICYAGSFGGFIDNEGMVGPCEHKKPFGSLRGNNYDFKKIWHCAEADRIRKDILLGCFCTNEPQWWHPTILYKPRIFRNGIRLIRIIKQQVYAARRQYD